MISGQQSVMTPSNYTTVPMWAALSYALLLVIFLSTGPVIKSAITHVAALLSLFALVFGWTGIPDLSRDTKRLLIAFFAYVAAAALSLINNDNWAHAGWRFEKYHPFLLAILWTGLIVRFRRPLIPEMLAGIVLGSLALAAFSGYESWIAGTTRVGNPTGLNPNIFGHVAFIYALALVSAAFYYARNIWTRLIFLVGASGAFYAGLTSGSRGALLAFVIGIVTAAVFAARSVKPKKSTALITAGIVSLLLLCLALFLLNSPFWLPHLTSALDETRRFLAGDTQPTSVGARLTMWSGAWKIWLEHPLIGTGIGDAQEDVGRLIGTGAILPMEYASSFAVFHCIYADSLATTGLVGITAMLLAVFIMPFGFFRAALSDANLSREGRFCAVTGIGLLAVNAVFGLTNSWLYLRGLPIILTVLILLISGCDHFRKPGGHHSAPSPISG